MRNWDRSYVLDLLSGRNLSMTLRGPVRVKKSKYLCYYQAVSECGDRHNRCVEEWRRWNRRVGACEERVGRALQLVLSWIRTLLRLKAVNPYPKRNPRSHLHVNCNRQLQKPIHSYGRCVGPLVSRRVERTESLRVYWSLGISKMIAAADRLGQSGGMSYVIEGKDM